MDKVLVGPEGSPNAPICLVGEAPGEQEVFARRPFIGPAGKLLDRLLASAGILRQDCYLTNVVKEQPPRTAKKSNDISTFVNLESKKVSETPAWQSYVKQLKEELSGVTSNVIVAVGQTALYALCGLPNLITKRRGGIYESTLLPGRKVVPIIHPSACLHGGAGTNDFGGKWEFQHYITFDLHRVKKESTFPEIRLSKRNICTSPSFQDACDWIAKIRDLDIIGFDIECVNLELYCFSIAHSANESMCITLKDFSPDKEVKIIELLALALEMPGVKKLGQNILFDSHFMFRKYGIVTRNLEDTMLAAGVLFPDFPKGLDFLVSIYCDGEPYYKDEGKNQFYEVRDPEAFKRYSAKDSAVLFDIFPKQLEELQKTGNLGAYKRSVAMLEPLLFMQERGICADFKGMQEGKELIKRKIQCLKNDLDALAAANGIVNLNWSSNDQLKDYFYITKGEKPYTIRRKAGQEPKRRKLREVRGREVDATNWSMDEEAKQRLTRKGHKEAELLLEVAALEKLQGTYLEVSLKDGERFTCSFNPVRKAKTGDFDSGTVSGRLSSGKNIFGEGMNMQTPPREDYEFEIEETL